MSSAPDVRAYILAGGAGTRLWPLSRLSLPKQFLALDGDETLLDATVSRLAPLVMRDRVTIVAGAAAASGEALLHLSRYDLLREPCARGTAAAIGIAALHAMGDGSDPVMVVLPADHAIRDTATFRQCLSTAIDEAASGTLVIFGIRADRPETGYGYVRTDDEQPAASVRRVVAFREKPDADTAAAYLRDGRYFWNAGMFVWRASAILQAIRTHLPELASCLDAIRAEHAAGGALDRAIANHFADAPNISIDHGVLEKAAAAQHPALHLVVADIGWSDVGSWDALYEIAARDVDGNSFTGNAIAIDCRNLLIRAGHHLVAAVGVEDIAVVDTPDAVLVVRRGASQQVKQVVDMLARRGGTEHLEHTTVRRPWGHYTVLDELPGCKIKRIEVHPGGRLSLQSHDQRSEHWVVVTGEATVTIDDHQSTLRANESTFIPIGAKHRLENLGETPLHIIEVQVGGYLGEDDIRRYDDAYGRSA